jgi:hypothetical protein
MFQRTGQLAVAGLVALAAGCSVQVGDGKHGGFRTGELERHTRIVEKSKAAGAEMIRAEINMAAGELRLSGGAKEMLEAEFAYNVPSFKPEVRFDGTGFRRRLAVEQTGGGSSSLMGDVKNRWDLKLAGDLPLDLAVRCGAGENHLDLRELTLRGVEMHIGVGEVRVDLRNKPAHDYSVRIDGGIGHAEVIVPTDVGVVAEASGGIGDISVRGMRREGNRWVNEAYGTSKATIRLTVKGGIGAIEIRAE